MKVYARRSYSFICQGFFKNQLIAAKDLWWRKNTRKGGFQFGESKLSVNLATSPPVILANFFLGQSIWRIYQSS